MTTSLAAQLQKLTTPQTTLLDEKRSRRSILFDPSEAAKYGRDIYQKIGKAGFDELAKIEKSLLQFEGVLFGPKTIDIQRAVMDKEANQKLDTAIDKCLLILSPYLEKQAALQAMEWLVYRFMAHEMNKRAFMMCIFPYYESALFIRILQIVDVKEETQEWFWLAGSQKTGRPVAKATVFTRWGAYQSFRSFVADYLTCMMKVHSNEGNQKIAISFFITTVVGGLCLLDQVKEQHLLNIVKVLGKSLSGSTDLRAGTYFLLAQLAVRTKLSPSLLKKILDLLVVVNKCPKTLSDQYVLLLLTLTQHQNVESFTPEVSLALYRMSDVFTGLEALARTKSVAPFLIAFVTGFMEWVVKSDNPLTDKEKSIKVSKMVERLSSIPLSASDAAKVIWSLMESIRIHYAGLSGVTMSKALGRLEASHPEGHSRAAAKLIRREADRDPDVKQNKITKLLLGHKSSGGSTSFLHLVHPDDTIRLQAVESFLARVAKRQHDKDETSTKLHLTSLLSDPSPAIVLETLQCDRGLRLLDTSLVVSRCLNILANPNTRTCTEWTKVRLVCLRVITYKVYQKLNGELRSAVLRASLPYVLFPKTADDLLLVKVVLLHSSLGTNEPFLEALSQELGPFLKDETLKPKKYVKIIWKILPRVLSSMTTEQHEVFWERLAGTLSMDVKPQVSEYIPNDQSQSAKSNPNDMVNNANLKSKTSENEIQIVGSTVKSTKHESKSKETDSQVSRSKSRESERASKPSSINAPVWSSLEISVMDHFVWLVLLSCALSGDKMATAVSLRLGHRLLDACLLALETVKICDMTQQTEGGTEQKQTDDKMEQTDDTDTTDTSPVKKSVKRKNLDNKEKGGVAAVNQTRDLPLDTFVDEVTTKDCLPLALIGYGFLQSLKAFSLRPACNLLPYWSLGMEVGICEDNLLLLVKGMKGGLLLERYGEYTTHTPTIKTAYTLRNTILTSVFMECLANHKQRFYFLSMMWAWDSTLPFSNILDDTLQTWALRLGAELLSSQTKDSSLGWCLSTSQPLVPSLLTALTHPMRFVRRQALLCVAKLSTVMGGRLTLDNHSVFIEAILSHEEELIADGSQVSSLLPDLQSSPKKCREVIQVLANIATIPDLPSHLRGALLYTLTPVMDSATLLKLMPVADTLLDKASNLDPESCLQTSCSLSLYYILLCLSPATCDVLEQEEGWKVFMKAVTCSRHVLRLHEEVVSPQSVLMDQVMSRKFFSSIKNEDIQSRLWSVLIARVIESGDPKEAEQLRKGLRKVALDAMVVARQIEELKLSDKATTIRAAQAKRRKLKEKQSVDKELVSWRKLGLMLETIGVMAGLSRPWLLVGPLCQCLQTSLSMDLVVTDITQQQLLSALLHILQNSSQELGDDLKNQVQINTEVVVQCVRASVSPDTHRRAMLILSFAAKIDPDSVIQKVMPIFTFMGTSLMRRDDSYSFQVIHQTIESIVPTLIQSESAATLEVKLGGVCQVFVDALPDVPQHRRLPLFTQLAKTIHADKHLWILLALIADAHVMRGSLKDEAEDDKGYDRRGVPQDIQFALTLASQFPVPTQTNACVRIMTYLNSLPQDTEDISSHQQRLSKKVDKGRADIICWDVHSPRQTCHFKHTAAGLMGHLLASEKFVGQVFEASAADNKEMRELYKVLLEKTMCYLSSVTQTCDRLKDKPSGRVLQSLQRKVIDVMDGVNAVLPPRMLLEVVGEGKKGLVASSIPMVRCKALEILCAKLQTNANFFSSEHHPSLCKLIKTLCKTSLNPGEPVENRQTALLALQLLTRLLVHHVSPEELQPVLVLATEIVCMEDVEMKITTQALLVVSEAVVGMKAHAVVHLTRLMPPLTHILIHNSQQQQQQQQFLLLAAVTATHKLIETVPQLLSPHLVSLVSALCGLSVKGEDQQGSRVATRIISAREAIVKAVEMRVLLPAMDKAFVDLSVKGLWCVGNLMKMMEQLVTNNESPTLTAHHQHLLALFTKACALRDTKGGCAEVEAVESSAFTALGKLLLRLNQHHNSDIFESFKSWAQNGKPTRLITFFRFADHLAGIFKVLFIKAQLAETMWTTALNLLARNNTINHNDTTFGSGKWAEEQSCLLLWAIMDALTKVFLYDSVGFVSQERFTQVVAPLTDQLENLVGGESEYQLRVESHLIPCLIKLTVAVGDDSLWKILNRQVLVRLRNDDNTQIVIGALRTFQALVSALGSDYLEPLLSDVMPYVTESLESSSSEVEEETRKVFTSMEGIMGHNLQEFLQY